MDWPTRYGRLRFKTGILASKILGKTTGAKILKLKNLLQCPEGLVSVCSKGNGENEHIIAIFGDQQAAQLALSITSPDLNGESLKQMDFNTRATNRNNAIRVWDIPLNTKQADIRNTFC